MFKGIGVSPGFVISKAYVCEREEISFEEQSSLSAVAEIDRYNKAVHKFIKYTAPIIESVKLNAGKDEAAILEAHIIMVEDPEITSGVVCAIRNGITAEAAVSDTYEMLAGTFESMEDEIMSHRARDLRDIKTRLIEILTGKIGSGIDNIKEDCVLICHDLTPSDIGRMDKSKVKAIVTEIGGATSHSAIISRGMEIPTVLSVENVTTSINSGDIIAINGSKGEVIVNPRDEELEELNKLMAAFHTYKKELEQYKGKQSITLDGHRVEIVANIGTLGDLKAVLKSSAEGIGLFRSEILFMNTNKAPDEDAQFEIYKKAAIAMAGKPVIIRTLDIGGDKDIPYFNMEKEKNPFLGYRAIRFCLGDLEMFSIQLRALLRASFYGNIKIMLPMITTVTELRASKNLIEQLKKDLKSEGKPFNENIEVGIMIETPAACMIADLLARECEFFSIGTNDLTQYTMAADRENKKVQYLYSIFDPAVMRLIYRAIKAGKDAGIVVGICGEGASDVNMIPFLVAAGLDEFSMSPSSVLQARKAICSLKKEELEKDLDKVMALETKDEVFEYMQTLAK